MRIAAAAAMLILGPLSLPAQTTTSFLTLHTFTAQAGSGGSNNDGGSPVAGLALCGNTLYGTTSGGGSRGFGTVFAINTNGSNFATLYSFTNGTDGAAPKAPLLPAGGVLYGTATSGGSSNYGTVFMLNTTGSGFTTLYTFTNGSDGAGPAAGLALSGETLYGTTAGSFSGPKYGTIFKLTTNGSSFSVLHTFSPLEYPSDTNSDGALPSGPLFLSGTTFYGSTEDGGANGTGVLFAVDSGEPGFSNLRAFAATTGYPPHNVGGANPAGGLVLSGGTMYGAAAYGGSSGWGTVYQASTNGSGITPLHSFTAGSDSLNPQGPLMISGKLVYGVTPDTIFAVSTNGAGFTNLFTFPLTATNSKGIYTNATGYAPNGGFILAGETFYGTAQTGGSAGVGTVFAFNLFPAAISLAIRPVAGGVVLSWTNSVFVLQSAPALSGPYTTIAGATSPYTNALTGTQMFFRLRATAAISLGIKPVAGGVVLSWTNPVFVLQSAATLSGPYTTIAGATSPYTNALTGTQMFFRLRAN